MRQSLNLLFLIIVSALSTKAHANVLKDAWGCASANIKMNYEMASKGFQASEIIGSNPQCVALATAQDPPLLVLTGTLFALNAVKPDLLPAKQCNLALKKTAAAPIAFAIDSIVGNKLPAKYKDTANAEAQAQLWDYLNSTPPFDQIIGRASCGCTFLEAGISIENLIEMINLVASTGKKCEKILNNIPGYKQTKGAINNLGEDLFTNQYEHKPVDEYYRIDFAGCENCWEKFSHAAAEAINPSHDWMSANGAAVAIGKNYKSAGGAVRGQIRVAACKDYFDSHKMSPENAEKVCNTLAEQFKGDYKKEVPKLKARDQLVRELQKVMEPLDSEYKKKCEDIYTNTTEAILCRNEIVKNRGELNYGNPYDGSVLDSLGGKYSKSEIDQMLKGTQEYYFAPPLAMSGAQASAWQALHNNGFNVNNAVLVAVSAYRSGADSVVQKYQLQHQSAQQSQKKIDDAVLQKEFQQQVGAKWGLGCTGLFAQNCKENLRKAWDLCQEMTNKKIPFTGTGDVKVQNAQKLKEYVELKCHGSYEALIAAFKKYTAEYEKQQSAEMSCPKANFSTFFIGQKCKTEAADVRTDCVGGLPFISEQYHELGQVSQQPEALENCMQLESLFQKKWQANTLAEAQLLQTQQSALVNCTYAENKKCVTDVKAQFAVFQKQIANEVKTKVWITPLKSNQIVKELSALEKTVAKMQDQMLLTSLEMRQNSNKEANVLMNYGEKCPDALKNEKEHKACKAELLKEFKNCQSGLENSKNRSYEKTGPQHDEVKLCGTELEKVIAKYFPKSPALVKSNIGVKSALDEFVQNFESSNLEGIKRLMDPATPGLQRTLDNFAKEFAENKGQRFHIYDLQVKEGRELGMLQFRWEKRSFNASGALTPSLLTGQTSMLLSRIGNESTGSRSWQIKGFTGDSLARSESSNGSLAQVTASPLSVGCAGNCSNNMTFAVVDTDMAGVGSVQIELTNQDGDREVLILTETTAGTFVRNLSLAFSIGSQMTPVAIIAGNNVIEHNQTQAQITVSYLDNKPGKNQPPRKVSTQFTASFLFL